jgi:hypothetical protein
MSDIDIVPRIGALIPVNNRKRKTFLIYAFIQGEDPVDKSGDCNAGL